MKIPDYIKLYNDGLEPHVIPSNTHLYCNRCYNRGYVSEEEMQFLMDSGNIIQNQIITPHYVGEDNFPIVNDKSILFYQSTEYVYVSAFCPKCDRAKFGKLSDWRE